MVKSAVTPQSQLEAVKRYRESQVRYTAGAKRGTPRGDLLALAKESGQLSEKFWEFLENNFSVEHGWKE